MIRVSEVVFGGREKEYVAQALATRRITLGPFVARFEEALARTINVEHVIATTSGTTALHLALLAAGVEEHDSVVVPALSYVATANAVSYCGAKPIFVDIDPKTWAIDLKKAAFRINGMAYPPKFMLLTQLYGCVPNMDEVVGFCREYGMSLIEDSAEALGGSWKGRHAGTYGVAGAFSFYGNKLITCGEGGAVVTNDSDLADQVRLLRGQGSPMALGDFTRHRFFHEVIGYNYRMTDLQAAVGLAQLERIAEITASRVEVFSQYEELLPEFERPTSEGLQAPWLFTILLPKNVDRDAVIDEMAENGVETRPVFIPINELPPYLRAGMMQHEVAHDVSVRGISLPTYEGLSKQNIERVVSAFRYALAICVLEEGQKV